MHLHAVHEERAVPGDHHGAPARPVAHRTAEGHPDTGTEAVTHAAHAECDGKPAVPANGQVMDGGCAVVACVDDDIRPVGQHAVKHDHRIAVSDTQTLEDRGLQFFVGHLIRYA